MNKRIFITGASGYIGSKLSQFYLNLGYDVVSILHDNSPKSPDKILGINQEIIWCNGDMRDTNLVRRIISDYEIEEIIHTAAMPLVRIGYRTTTPILDNNIMGTVSILEAANEQHQYGLPIKMIHMSSDKAYGNLGRIKPDENSRFNPNDVYSCSKSCSDLIAQVYQKLYKLPLIIVRPCNIFGFYDPNPRIIPNTIISCLRGERPKIFNGIESIREFIFNEDICDIYFKLLNCDSAIGEVFNLGTGYVFNQKELVLKILEHFLGIDPIYTEPPLYTKDELQYEKLDCNKIHGVLNWKPKYTFDEALNITIQDYTNWHEQFIRK